MKKTICDKCGKELREDEAVEMYVDGAGNVEEEYFDLCPDCREKLIDWLAGSCPCKKQAAEIQAATEKPAKAPKKKTWSMKDLVEKFGKNRSTISDALKKLAPLPGKTRVVDPVKKDRWWYEYTLTDPQMKELAKRFKGGAK